MRGSILVTGASGFIGRHLVADLQRRRLQLAPLTRQEIAPDTDWSASLTGVEVVIHLAALAHERAQAHERRRDYEALRRVNALGTACLAQAAAKAGVRHFIFLSTIGVCGEQTFGQPFTEETPPAPRSLYAASKLEAEQLLAGVGVPVTVLRPTLVYGPGNGGNLLRLLKLIDQGWPLPFGAVDNKRSLTCVHNLVSAILALLERSGANERFLVCDAEPLSTADIVRHLAAGMQRPASLVPVPNGALQLAARALGKPDLARRLLGSLEVDSSRLTRLAGWRPAISSSRGLFETGERFRGR